MKIIKLDKKSGDWYVATIEKDDKSTLENVSINRESKKGDKFPNFDTLGEGQDIQGTLWQSDKGKWYLFAPKKSDVMNSQLEGMAKSVFLMGQDVIDIKKMVLAIGKHLKLGEDPNYPKRTDDPTF